MIVRSAIAVSIVMIVHHVVMTALTAMIAHAALTVMTVRLDVTMIVRSAIAVSIVMIVHLVVMIALTAMIAHAALTVMTVRHAMQRRSVLLKFVLVLASAALRVKCLCRQSVRAKSGWTKAPHVQLVAQQVCAQKVLVVRKRVGEKKFALLMA
jgi:hypothetical protein